MRSLLIFFFLFLSSYPHVFAKSSPSIIESLILVNFEHLSNDPSKIERRASVSTDQIDPIFEENSLELEEINLPTPSFSSKHGSPVAVLENLSNSLQNIFTTNVSTDDFRNSLSNAASVIEKYDFNLNQKSSLLKTFIDAYLKTSPEPINSEEIVKILFQEVLPYSQQWKVNAADLLGILAQISIESLLENQFSDNSSSFANFFSKNLVSLMNDTENYFKDSLYPLPETQTEDPNTKFFSNLLESSGAFTGISPIPDRNNPVEDMMFGGLSGFDPKKTHLFQRVAAGLTDGYFNISASLDPDNALTTSHFDIFSSYPSSIISNDSSDTLEEVSIVSSFVEGLIGSLHEITLSTESPIPSNELAYFANHAIKSASNGFLLSSTVAATSNDAETSSNLAAYAVERIAKGLTASAVISNINQSSNDDTNSEIEFIFDPGRIVESVSTGAAMGSQLASVLPKSMEYSNSWEIFSNARKILSQAVSAGSTSGAVDTMSIVYLENPKSIELIEQVARSAALGSMMGNTGLAIYYPTNKLQSIIESSALGSSFGATSNNKLEEISEVKKGTENVEVSLARESAQGSTLGAAFMQTVLLGDLARLKMIDEKSVDHFSSASFGATYGAILGIKDRVSNTSDNEGMNPSEDFEVKELITEVSQATKQGSTEGAFAASRISLGLGLNSKEVDSSNLGSKSKILKAINISNSNALVDSNSILAAESLKVDSKDMLLLMKRYGINPKFTNAAKVYKKPVVVQVEEPKVDDNFTESVVSASPF